MRPEAQELAREAKVRIEQALVYARMGPENRGIEAWALLTAMHCLAKAWAASGLDYPDEYDRRRAG